MGTMNVFIVGLFFATFIASISGGKLDTDTDSRSDPAVVPDDGAKVPPSETVAALDETPPDNDNKLARPSETQAALDETPLNDDNKLSTDVEEKDRSDAMEWQGAGCGPSGCPRGNCPPPGGCGPNGCGPCNGQRAYYQQPYGQGQPHYWSQQGHAQQYAWPHQGPYAYGWGGQYGNQQGGCSDGSCNRR